VKFVQQDGDQVKKTLPVNTDVEEMTGRVGDYITIEEILED
jgi:peroxiredoxin (alkyl hydroperoxide reductase subunit C)